MMAVGILFVACGSGDDAPSLVLDGRPRPPDAQGVVMDVSREKLTLDGGRTYAVSDRLQCFSTATLEPLPLAGRLGQYVHVGLDGDTVVWLAAVGGVIDGDQPRAYYQGTVKEASGGRVVFDDGTVLRLAGDTEAPEPGAAVLAAIDVDARRVVALTAQRTDS